MANSSTSSGQCAQPGDHLTAQARGTPCDASIDLLQAAIKSAFSRHAHDLMHAMFERGAEEQAAYLEDAGRLRDRLVVALGWLDSAPGHSKPNAGTAENLGSFDEEDADIPPPDIRHMVQVARRDQIRGFCLKLMDRNRPNASHLERLLGAVRCVYPDATRRELARHLDYLELRGYVRSVGKPSSLAGPSYVLTDSGIDAVKDYMHADGHKANEKTQHAPECVESLTTSGNGVPSKIPDALSRFFFAGRLVMHSAGAAVEFGLALSRVLSQTPHGGKMDLMKTIGVDFTLARRCMRSATLFGYAPNNKLINLIPTPAHLFALNPLGDEGIYRLAVTGKIGTIVAEKIPKMKAAQLSKEVRKICAQSPTNAS